MTPPAAPLPPAAAVDVTALPPAVRLDLGPAGAGGLATSLPCLLLGWSVRETSGAAAAVVVLHDGTDATGGRAAEIGLASAGSVTVAIPPPGLWFRDGVFAEVVAGAVRGELWYVPITAGT